ncbi:MAG: iron-sulfur cluster assembly accessory protein [Deltaproteobacteria bacterium]|nr:MAG: iron-sulfur cluster assembly accessory protein [Deltaproteobacteria bacterium]
MSMQLSHRGAGSACPPHPPRSAAGDPRDPSSARPLRLTGAAAEAVRDRAREAGVSDHLLRIAVVAGGCNGLSYDLYLVPEALPDDAVVESCGVRVAVDAASARLLEGTLVDLRGRSFVFQNPRARKSCSCGASFEV